MYNSDFDKMKIDYKKRMNNGNKNTIFFPLFAVLFILIGVYFLNNTNEFIKDAKTTTAKIYTKDKLESARENGIEEYVDYAEYFVNGVRYYERLGTGGNTTFSFGPIHYTKTRNGEETIIYYDPSNPTKIMEKSSSKVSYIFIGLGIIIFVASVGSFIYNGLVNIGVIKPKITGEDIQDKLIDALDNDTIHNILNTEKKISISLNKIVKIIFIVMAIFIIFLIINSIL